MSVVTFPHNGPTRVALSYAAMRKDRPFDKTDLSKCFFNKFRKPYEAQKSLDILHKCGFIRQEGNGWVITPEGFVHLKTISKEYFRKNQ